MVDPDQGDVVDGRRGAERRDVELRMDRHLCRLGEAEAELGVEGTDAIVAMPAQKTMSGRQHQLAGDHRAAAFGAARPRDLHDMAADARGIGDVATAFDRQGWHGEGHKGHDSDGEAGFHHG